MAPAMISSWLTILSACARRRIPVILKLQTHEGRRYVARDVLIVEVARDYAITRSRLGSLRRTIRFVDLLGVERIDGRALRAPRTRDAREELREVEDAALDRGGLEDP